MSTIPQAMAKLCDKGAPHTFLVLMQTAGQPAEPVTPAMLVRKEVLDATHAVLEKTKMQQHAHAIPLSMAFKWALKGRGPGSSRRRKAILSIMEALAASNDFWEYARGPAKYDVKGTWETGVGPLKVHFTPRLKQLLLVKHTAAAS